MLESPERYDRPPTAHDDRRAQRYAWFTVLHGEYQLETRIADPSSLSILVSCPTEICGSISMNCELGAIVDSGHT